MLPTSDALDFPGFNKALTMFSLSAEDKIKCKEFLEHPDSHGSLYPPEEVARIQVAFLVNAGVSWRPSGVKSNPKFGAYADVGNGIFNGPRILPALTELLFMGVIYHGKYDRTAMETLHANTWNCGPDEEYADRILQIKKDSIYILGYKHLFTSLFNEDPTLSKNNIKILSNPSIGLLRFEGEVKPYTELTVSYGDSILCDLSPVDPNVGRSSKRARELPSRYEPTLSSKTRKDRNKKRLPSQEVDGVDLTQDSCLANEDSESEATDVFTNSDRQAANYLRKNPAKIVDFIKSFSAEELKEYGLQVKVIDSRKVNSNEKENTSVSSLDNEEDSSVEDSV
jgi:hypothetical protein